MKVRSPLIWFGGKSKYAEYIISKMPKHKVYIEPFGGAAHVIAQKPRVNHEVYNDIDGQVVNFIMQSIENTEKLIEKCSSIPYSRELYEKWRKESLPMDHFEKAVRYFYMNRSAISKGNAELIPNTGWRHSTTSSQNPAMGYISACEIIRSFAERMKGVMIEHTDFRTILEKYDSSEALFYVDPPYIGREKYYAGGFTEQDHRDLAELLNKAKAHVVLSYYDDPLLDELYKGWTRDTFKTFKQVVGDQNLGSEAEEVLLMNFQDNQLTLF